VSCSITQDTVYTFSIENTPATLSTVVQTAGGRFVKLTNGTWQPQYYYTDHRGDIRVVYRPNPTTRTAEVVQEDHLTPFGVRMVGLGRTSWPDNQYHYQGKELNATGFDKNGDGVIDSRLYQYDFNSRQYDPLIGRWHSLDPATQFSSPYLAMGNDWANRTDPDGQFLDRMKGHQVTGRNVYYYWSWMNTHLKTWFNYSSGTYVRGAFYIDYEAIQAANGPQRSESIDNIIRGVSSYANWDAIRSTALKEKIAAWEKSKEMYKLSQELMNFGYVADAQQLKHNRYDESDMEAAEDALDEEMAIIDQLTKEKGYGMSFDGAVGLSLTAGPGGMANGSYTAEQTIRYLMRTMKPGMKVSSDELLKIQPRVSGISYVAKGLERTETGFKIDRTLLGRAVLLKNAEVTISDMTWATSIDKALKITANFTINGYNTIVINNNAYRGMYLPGHYTNPIGFGNDG